MAWQGSARAATLAPSPGKVSTTCRQGTTHTSTRSRQGKGQAARGHHGRNPRCGRRWSRGHQEAIDKISQTGRSTVAGSIERTPSRRLAPAGAVGIECGGDDGDSVARARARGEGEREMRRRAGSE
jgi:hypothetical protein